MSAATLTVAQRAILEQAAREGGMYAGGGGPTADACDRLQRRGLLRCSAGAFGVRYGITRKGRAALAARTQDGAA
jgi:hypothetical protein